MEHSEDLGSVEEKLDFRRQTGWVDGWEDRKNDLAGAVGQNVGQKTGALGAVTLSDSDARRLKELAEAAAAGGGLPERNPRATAQLRRACGDPLFFEHLKESIGDRQRDGKKFLTHEEEMDLGTKVQRYRRLTEVRCVVGHSIGWSVNSVWSVGRSVDRPFGRSLGHSACLSNWSVVRPCIQSVGHPIRSVGHSVGQQFSQSIIGSVVR